MKLPVSEFLTCVRDGSVVKRYHTLTTHVTETVGHHSHEVAMLCYYLSSGEPSINLLMAALVHDLHEQVTGDIPAPAKRASRRAVEKNLEVTWLGERGLYFPLHPRERRILKLADCFSGALFCISEKKMGSSMLNHVFDNYVAYVIPLLTCESGAPLDPEIKLADLLLGQICSEWEVLR